MDSMKKFFPIFTENPKVLYLDSGASSQKPASVIESMDNFYRTYYANIHRGMYDWSERASSMYDEVRLKVANFIGAKSADEIVFTRGTTSAINMVAMALRDSGIVGKGDVIMVSEAEHHSNMLPWRHLSEVCGAELAFIPVDMNTGMFDADWMQKHINDKVKIVAISGQSNVLGVTTNVREIADIVHSKSGAMVLVDGAQLTAHTKVNVREIGADFYAFSGHKIYGPTGIGALYGRTDILAKIPPVEYGGDMVEAVSFSRVEYKEAPSKFEAGTPPIAEVVGLGAAIDFLQWIGMDKVEKYLCDLTHYAVEKIGAIEGVKILSARNANSVISFVIDGISPFDVGTLLGKFGVCVRVGKHCAEPLHIRMGVDSSIRVSLGLYNDRADIDVLVDSLQKIIPMLR